MQFDYLNYIKRLEAINPDNFDQLAMEVFYFQAKHNRLYADYIRLLHIDPLTVKHPLDIPFLPINFFKSHKVGINRATSSCLSFESSGTTAMHKARHWVAKPELYHIVLQQGVEHFYGSLENKPILALLPSYLERGNSSLVYMVQQWMDISGHPACGFYLNNTQELIDRLAQFKNDEVPILIGVTFALIDLAEQYKIPLAPQLIVMETGGMKGRRKEWTREEVHNFLKASWRLEQIHSEYGMTELLSQAYAQREGIFHCSPSLKVFCRAIEDPLATYPSGRGALNIIDLANLYSCSFIATEDLGRVYEDGSFEVAGRMDHSALRGCSLLTA